MIKDQSHRMQLLSCLLGVAFALPAPAAAQAAVTFHRINTIGVSVDPNFAMARTADGTLHLVYPTTAARNGVDGLAAKSISAAGVVGPDVQALSGWQISEPGLTTLPNGTLEAVFGAISPGPNPVSSLWGVASSNGGSAWSTPVDVRSGPNEALAYASPITARTSGATPVLTVPQAGNLVIQQGLGVNTPTYQVNDATDGSVVDVDSAVDAATGAVVASWQSLAGPGGLYLQGVAPTLGAPQLTPGQHRSSLVVAGRDAGPGVFAAYTPDGTHVSLLRYGGGTVPVGSLGGVTAKALGVATGAGGRIWVMWGDENGGLGVTRSNKAVTKFEPIQRLNPHAFTLYRLSGDGRLGPLDLFVDQIPNSKGTIPPPGSFYARVLPQLSASLSVKNVKNKSGHVIAHKLTATVTDAGDPVAGVTVAVQAKQQKTNASGIAKITLPGSASGRVTVTISASGYAVLKKRIAL